MFTKWWCLYCWFISESNSKRILKIVEASLASDKNYVAEYLCRFSHRNRLIPFLRHPELEIFSKRGRVCPSFFNLSYFLVPVIIRDFVRHFQVVHFSRPALTTFVRWHFRRGLILFARGRQQATVLPLDTFNLHRLLVLATATLNADLWPWPSNLIYIWSVWTNQHATYPGQRPFLSRVILRDANRQTNTADRSLYLATSVSLIGRKEAKRDGVAVKVRAYGFARFRNDTRPLMRSTRKLCVVPSCRS